MPTVRHRICGCLLLATLSLLSFSAVGRADGASVYVEDSPAAQDLLAKARSLRATKRLSDAVRPIQEVLDRHGWKLAKTDPPDLYVDLRRHVHGMLMADEPWLAVYRRAYEPKAQGELERAMMPAPTPESLASIFQRFGLCPSGLEAGLRLAGFWLGRANPMDAASVLDALAGHPDLATQRVRWHRLQAMAGVYADDMPRVQKHLNGLKKLIGEQANETQRQAAEQAVADLRDLARSLARPAPDVALDPLSPLPEAAIPQPLGDSLWSLPLPSPAHMFGDASKGRTPFGANRLSGDSREYPLMPVVHGDLIVTNDGWTMLAVDRASGQKRWRYDWLPRDAITPIIDMVAKQPPLVVDLRSAAIDGDRVFGVIGHAQNTYTTNQLRDYLATTSIVCLRRSDGTPMWRIGPGDIDEAMSNAFFHGTPIADAGRLYVVMRRTQSSGFQTAWVVALDQLTGRPLWRRHLSSTSLGRRVRVITLSQMQPDGGRLYVSDNLGSVSCLSRHDGATIWLRATPMIEEVIEFRAGVRRRMPVNEGEQPSPPIRVEAGLFVPPAQKGAAAMLLDPDTGKLIRQVEHPAWDNVEYVLSVAGGVLAVGDELTFFDGEKLEVAWRRATSSEAEPGPEGRLAVAGNRVYMPSRNRLLVLDGRTGAPIARHLLQEPGNVLPMDGQLIVAGSRSLRSYMGWEHLRKELLRRLDHQPLDPRPAIALAHVSLNTGRRDAMLEAIDLALAAIRKNAARQITAETDEPHGTVEDSYFPALLAFVDPDVNPDTRLRRVLFDRIATATAGAKDEVAYQLTLGDYLVETKQFAQAIDHYQAVLMDPTLAGQMFEHDGRARQAGLEARLRLQAVVEKAGREIYEQYEMLAAERLAALVAQPGVTAEPLQALAEQFPLATSAPLALAEAADRLAEAGDLKVAASQLHRAYQRVVEPEHLQRIVGRLAELYLLQQRHRRARQWLLRARREHPGLEPLRDGKPVSIDQWLASFAAAAAAELNLPEVAAPSGPPVAVRGRLMQPVAQPRFGWPRGQVLTLDGSRLTLRRGVRLEAVWTATLPHPECEVLAMSTEVAILWCPARHELLSLDMETGRRRWDGVDVSRMLNRAGTELERHRRQPLELRGMNVWVGIERARAARGATRRASAGQMMFAVNDSMVCVGDRAGRVVGLDRMTGEVRWGVLAPMERLSRIVLNEDDLLLAGENGVNSNARNSSVLVLDPVTGEPRLAPLVTSESLIWTGMGGDGLLLMATAKEMAAHRLIDGRLAWRMEMSGATLQSVAHVGADLALIQDSGGSLIAIDAMLGRRLNVVSSSFVDAIRRFVPVSVEPAADQWHLLTPRGALAIGSDGRIRWSDAVDGAHKRFALQLIAHRHVVLLSRPDRARRPLALNQRLDELRGVGPPPWHLHLVERDTGRLLSETLVEGIPGDITAGVLLDGQIVLGTEDVTIAIPAATADQP